MFKRRTLFILGAGASHEAKLPIGSTLAHEISNKLDIRFEDGYRPVGSGDRGLYEQLYRGRREEAPLIQQACWLIRDGIHLANSIDDFLDLHHDNAELVTVGKATIVKCILEAEKASSLFYDHRQPRASIDFPKLHDTWFNKFMKMAGRGVRLGKAETVFDNLSFIVFNYDRCLEHFLLNALQRLYGMGERDAAPIAASVKIVHPYGSLAPLLTDTSPSGVRFGHKERDDYPSLATNIKTYTEQQTEGEELDQIRREIENAECIVFLGFGFLDQNMRLLTPAEKMQRKPVFATTFGMSDDDTALVVNQIKNMFTSTRPEQIRVTNKCRCSDLFDNYSRSLC